MKTFKFYFAGINPIYRDLMLVLLTGLLASLTMVTIGFMVLKQV